LKSPETTPGKTVGVNVLIELETVPMPGNDGVGIPVEAAGVESQAASKSTVTSMVVNTVESLWDICILALVFPAIATIISGFYYAERRTNFFEIITLGKDGLDNWRGSTCTT
jgi:hypothetical protein